MIKRPFVAATILAACAGAACAGESITLFGQKYDVVALNYFDQVRFENPLDPTEIVGLIESEGVFWLGKNRLLLSSDAGDVQFGIKDIVVEAELKFDGGVPSGLEYVRTVVASDSEVTGWELSPAGVTINTSGSGLGAGGGLIVADNENNMLRAYAFDGAGLLEFPPLSGCLASGSGLGCGFDLGELVGQPEDVAFASTRNIFGAVDEDDPATYAVGVFDAEGKPLYRFPIGSLAGSPTTGTAKGLTFLSPAGNYPAALKPADGAFLVALDNDGPGLQAFDLDGKLIGFEPLTDDGTATGKSLIGADLLTEQLIIESLSGDPETGRLFLVNQGDGFSDSFLFVLTPVSAECGPDCTGDGRLNINDFICFQSEWRKKSAYGDYDGNGVWNINDFIAFQADWRRGC